jgi:two-component system OmpR family response regulator
MTRILLVDDEPTVRRVMRLALERAEFTVTAAENGEVALAAIREAAPDVLITDIEMPRMNGRALCAAIEKEFPDRRFPIFVVTSLTEREHRRWSTLISNLYFAEKPISVRKLIKQLHEYLNEHGTAAGNA